jgi:hypothetical protein
MAQVPSIELPDMAPAVQALLAGVPPLNVLKPMANPEAVTPEWCNSRGPAFQRGARQATQGTDHFAGGLRSHAPSEIFQHRQAARFNRIAPEKVDALRGSLDIWVFTPIEYDVLTLTDVLLENEKVPTQVLAGSPRRCHRPGWSRCSPSRACTC